MNRIRPMSNRRRREKKARRECVHAVKERSGGMCEARLLCCCGRGDQAHEKLSRAQGGDPTDAANVLWLCWKCHARIHRFPMESAKRGLLLSRKYDAKERPA